MRHPKPIAWESVNMKFAPLDTFSRLRMVSLVTRSAPVLGRHSPFFGLPIFSALRSASRAPIPPAASAVTLQHSRSSVRCSIRRAGQRRLEKAADALKVSTQAGAQVLGKFLSGKRPPVERAI